MKFCSHWLQRVKWVISPKTFYKVRIDIWYFYRGGSGKIAHWNYLRENSEICSFNAPALAAKSFLIKYFSIIEHSAYDVSRSSHSNYLYFKAWFLRKRVLKLNSFKQWFAEVPRMILIYYFLDIPWPRNPPRYFFKW